MGGTFDPIHLGHLRAAEEFADLAGLSRVMFVPAARNPIRPGGPEGASPEQRLQMARLAVEGNMRFVAADLEVRRGGPSYTVETLEELSQRLPQTTLVLGMGADAWAEFGSWRRPADIATLADIVVMTRPGSPPPDLLGALPPELRKGCLPEGGEAGVLRLPTGRTLASLPITPLDISATLVRSQAGQGRSLRYLVPDAVYDFILQERLYGAVLPPGEEP